jgi:hypothetical protein
MPYLFCGKHGREHEADARQNQAHYRREGESVLVIKGRLISGPWQCDQCNAPLEKGAQASLFAAYPSWMTESTYEYDFWHERKYFELEHAEVTVYGAAWPVTLVAKPGRPPRAARQRFSRPLCGLDVRPNPSDQNH